ncbi:rhodanese-like domain-containing protein [Novosphingobium mangrovi (ex Huang et al. 2023)]|uniref:Rhodanese n=1 Tax=Novosphingobium mangrovi (ex Huang et al. 2023) TaxID=2976432 RepID=A0ABT2I1S5_9SPHN|nr:rhodanese-like domain-containing protein [Novosphingobium mangrovi (ex Huang et al. 2023)]MCT2398756.1 rhodanese [Novosphingobium mangrovi (ex Huang et al. 2023)]
MVMGRQAAGFLGLVFALAGGVADAGGMLPAPVAARAQVQASEFDIEGYRATRFRAPVTRPPAPAARIALADALQLDPGRDALFIDVLPVESGVRDPGSGAWRISSEHWTIPGARWHPEIGRSPPDPVLWQGLRKAIAAAREARPDMPVVLFCRADCWMGWNAARRLAREGVPHVLWLAEGIEGWHEAGRTLIRADPEVIAAP